MKKFLSILMCVVLCLTVFGTIGCGPTSSSGGKTILRVVHANGGTGDKWLTTLEKKFEEKYANKQYAPGKRGVEVKTNGTLSVDMNNIAGVADDIYFIKSGSIVSFAAKDLLLELSDIMNEDIKVGDDYELRDGERISIADKVDDILKVKHTYGEGVYGIPSEIYLEGVTYDAELFNTERLYIASETATEEECWLYTATDYVDSFGDDATIKLVSDLDAPRSLGPDGKPNTTDDGLPSSISEWLVLCHYMKRGGPNIAPVSVSGEFPNYSNHFVSELWKSLAGERYSSYYNFEGEVEIVTGVYDDQYLFKTNKVSIKKPKTEMVDITIENGYKARDMVERYYANAVIEIMYKEGYFSDQIGSGNINHVEAQKRFICNGKSLLGNTFERVAMHVDGGYWWNESVQNGNFDAYKRLTPGCTNGQNRDLRWMSMPVQWSGSVTEDNKANAHDYMIERFGSGTCVVNANVLGKKDTAEMLAVIKDFIHFAYTDENMNNFTKQTGMVYNVNYDVDPTVYNSLSKFYQSMTDMLKTQEKPYYNMNKVYLNSSNLFNFGLLSVYTGAGEVTSSFLGNLKAGSAGAAYANTYTEFKFASITESEWKGILKASGVSTN